MLARRDCNYNKIYLIEAYETVSMCQYQHYTVMHCDAKSASIPVFVYNFPLIVFSPNLTK